MSRAFSITPAASSVTLDSAGRGKISFTVTYTAGPPLRALASLKLSESLKPEWLKLRGAVERGMVEGSSEVFIVEVQVPPGTRSGSHTFRLVVADSSQTDEHFTVGPSIELRIDPRDRFKGLMLAVLAVLVVAGIAGAVMGNRGPPREAPCPTGQQMCLGQCLDTQSNAQHCGGCDKACVQDQTCQNGTCQCAQGLLFCAGACVNPDISDQHCGGCGRPCGEHFDCQGGECVRTECPGGQTLCHGTCVDWETDANNCGGCGNICAPYLRCRSGKCVCEEKLQDCDRACVDTTSDESNCGACGNKCGADQVCRAGVCQCATVGLALCSGKCVDTRTDSGNCAGCGNKCGAHFVCQNSSCQCEAGLTLCGNSCVSLQDEAHCGSCSSSCSSNQECQEGHCVTRDKGQGCSEGQVLCTRVNPPTCMDIHDCLPKGPRSRDIGGN